MTEKYLLSGVTAHSSTCPTVFRQSPSFPSVFKYSTFICTRVPPTIVTVTMSVHLLRAFWAVRPLRNFNEKLSIICIRSEFNWSLVDTR